MGSPQARSRVKGNGRKAHDLAAVNSPLNIAFKTRNTEKVIDPNTVHKI
jgi:hypothetical protein